MDLAERQAAAATARASRPSANAPPRHAHSRQSPRSPATPTWPGLPPERASPSKHWRPASGRFDREPRRPAWPMHRCQLSLRQSLLRLPALVKRTKLFRQPSGSKRGRDHATGQPQTAPGGLDPIASGLPWLQPRQAILMEQVENKRSRYYKGVGKRSVPTVSRCLVANGWGTALSRAFAPLRSRDSLKPMHQRAQRLSPAAALATASPPRSPCPRHWRAPSITPRPRAAIDGDGEETGNPRDRSPPPYPARSPAERSVRRRSARKPRINHGTRWKKPTLVFLDLSASARRPVEADDHGAEHQHAHQLDQRADLRGVSRRSGTVAASTCGTAYGQSRKDAEDNGQCNQQRQAQHHHHTEDGGEGNRGRRSRYLVGAHDRRHRRHC